MKRRLVELFIWFTSLSANKYVNYAVSAIIYYVIGFWMIYLLITPFKWAFSWLK